MQLLDITNRFHTFPYKDAQRIGEITIKVRKQKPFHKTQTVWLHNYIIEKNQVAIK